MDEAGGLFGDDSFYMSIGGESGLSGDWQCESVRGEACVRRMVESLQARALLSFVWQDGDRFLGCTALSWDGMIGRS